MDIKLNPVSIVKELLRLVIDEFEAKEDDVPTTMETEVAQILFNNFCQITNSYLFLDENENDQNVDLAVDMNYIDDNGLEVKCSESNYLPLELKRKIVSLYDEKVVTKTWKYETLASKFKALKDRSYIKRWREQLATGGSKFDKFKAIEEHVLEKFKESRSEFLVVHDVDLRRWALQFSSNFMNFEFTASTGWLSSFKRKNGISSRKIQKFVSVRELDAVDSLLKAAEDFRRNFKAISNNFSPSHIFNTDQVGFTYEILRNRTLSWKGERRTWGFGFSPKNKGTHSYTLQPVINLDGKLVGDFLVCLKEPEGKLGKKVEEKVFAAPNLTVTCSASGKLSSSHVDYFLKKVIVPVVKEKFLLILDHYNAQINPKLFDIFGKSGIPSCQTMLIPKKCTATCQPLDRIVNRQFKFLAKKLFGCAVLDYRCNITDRDSILKLQSLIHFIFLAKIFEPMFKYSWVSAGLADGVKSYSTVQDVCFSFSAINCSGFKCGEKPFIECSHCCEALCFSHFYHDFHVMECKQSPFLKKETYEARRDIPLPSSSKTESSSSSEQPKKRRKGTI